MRISVLGLAFGISCTAALAVPMLPSHMTGDFWHMRSSYGVSQILDASARGVGNLLSMAAQADEAEAPAIDFDKLVKIDGREFEVSMDDSVSRTALSQHSVRMIGHGRISSVNVVRTPTGTYSTAGLVSPHIQYPGISVVEKTALQASTGMAWFHKGGWFPLAAMSKGSVVTYGNTQGGGSFIAGDFGVCSSGPGFAYCR